MGVLKRVLLWVGSLFRKEALPPRKVALYRYVDDELAFWGHYNLENESELTAYTEAVWQFASNGYRVKAVRVEQ